MDLSHSTGAIFYNDPFVPSDGKLTGPIGGFAGLEAGFNHQNGSAVIGLVADAALSSLHAHGQFTTIAPNYTTWDIDSKLTAFGTVRGRLGVANGNFLLYGTGGLAWGVTSTQQATNWYAPAPPDVGGRTSGTNAHIGYAVGAGAEWAINDRWSMKAEYLYVDLGKQNYALNGTNKPPSDPAAVPYTETFANKLAMQTFKVGLTYRFGN